MELEDFEKAKTIVSQLEAVERAFFAAQRVANLDEDDDYADASMTQYDDESGWRIDLSGTMTRTEMVNMVREKLCEKKTALEAELKKL